jgi:hypothetical protein
MPKATRQSTTTLSSPDALVGLRALADAPQPDAGLLLACDRFMILSEGSDTRCGNASPALKKRIQKAWPEMMDLEEQITKTPAMTALGRFAKAEVALRVLGSTGTIAQVARSVLRDFMNIASDQEIVA